MSKRRFNPMRPGPTWTDFFSKTVLATLFAGNVVGLALLGIISLSENDPRKKGSPVLRNDIPTENSSGMFDFDWKRMKLEWVNILQGIKIGGVPILKPNPNMINLEDYLREKEARIRAEKKEAERK